MRCLLLGCLFILCGVGLSGQDFVSGFVSGDTLYFVEGSDTVVMYLIPPGDDVYESYVSLEYADTACYTVDTLRGSVCDERGHVRSLGTKTLMYCGGPYLEDEKDFTVMVWPGCNYYEYSCLRCDTVITEKEETVRDTIWRRD